MFTEAFFIEEQQGTVPAHDIPSATESTDQPGVVRQPSDSETTPE
jgi:hypothetical protein